MFTTVIFDLDGTLVNSVADLADATNIALETLGFPTHEQDKFRYFVGDGVIELFRRALPEGEKTEENIAKMKRLFDEYYSTHFDNKTRPYEGIPEVVRELKTMGLKIAVASNKPDEFTRKIVNSFFPNEFDMTAGKRDGVEKKPAPDIVLKIMEQLGNEAIMVGDTNVDIRTAKAAGIASVGCLWGFRDRAELTAAGADFIAEKPADIVKYIILNKGVQI